MHNGVLAPPGGLGEIAHPPRCWDQYDEESLWMDVPADPPSSDWILRGTRVFAVECYLVDGEGKGQRLLGRHEFSTSASVKRNLTA